MCRRNCCANVEHSSHSRPRGFTLIEVLVAIFIFAWIALGSYQILDQVILAQSVNQQRSFALADTQRLSWRMAKDFRQIVRRPIVDEQGEEVDAVVLDTADNLIEFTTSGWPNPLQWPRSELQRVAYTVDLHPDTNDASSPHYGDDALYLIRKYWRVLDRVLDSEPVEQVVMADVAGFSTRFWDRENESWSDSVVDGLSTSGLKAGDYNKPYAIEVTIVGENDEVWTAIYQIL